MQHEAAGLSGMHTDIHVVAHQDSNKIGNYLFYMKIERTAKESDSLFASH